ncbi:MAG: PspA/IM30 family protein [Cyanobacteria bacterium J06639_1]
MKKAIYWILGEKAGRVVVGSWNWLWGIPIEAGGQAAVEVAEESLRSMQGSVQKLAEVVSLQVAAYGRAKQKYEAKARELDVAERQALVAQRNGNQAAARLAMTKALQIEKLLPQLEEQVHQTEEFVTASRAKLDRERLKLEAYKTDLQNMKDAAEIDRALTAAAKVNSDLDIDSARAQFEQAKSAVQRRSLRDRAYAELSENPAEQLNAELEQMTLDDEVSRRLQALEREELESLPESSDLSLPVVFPKYETTSTVDTSED